MINTTEVLAHRGVQQRHGDQNRPEDLHKSHITEQVLRERRQLA